MARLSMCAGFAVMTGGILRRLTVVMALAATSCLPGCAGTTTFTAYPGKINPLIENLKFGRPVPPGPSLIDECRSSDGILYSMERGRIALITGDTDASLRDFSAAMEKIRENDGKALISASRIGANVAATAVNDNAVPYEGEGYERVLLHHYQALNFLNKRDLEGAGVEVRRANAEQDEALKRNEEELERVLREADEKKIEIPLNNPEFSKRYARMDELAGRVKNSFQNACTFYLSAFIYELLQQPNDAYIDYKKALEIYPENSFLQKDAIRLARALEMNADLADLRERFRIDAESAPVDNGDFLILFEDGFAPQKQEVKIPIPVPEVGLLAAAFPIYDEVALPYHPLSVDKDGEHIGSTEPVCDVRALSIRALKEKVPVIAVRQIVRLLAKGAANKMAGEQLGGFGQFVVNVWTLVSEQADLRSWLTLPANAQILRAALPVGNHRLTLRQNGMPGALNVGIDVAKGSRTILYVVRAGRQFYYSLISFPATTGNNMVGGGVHEGIKA